MKKVTLRMDLVGMFLKFPEKYSYDCRLLVCYTCG